MNSGFEKYQFEDVFTASDDYASRFSGDAGKWLLSVQEQTILELIANKLSSKAEILDIGGAHGQLIPVARILQKNLQILASHDDAFKFLAGRENNPDFGQTVSDIFSLPFEKNSFELVTSVRLISHCEPWQKLVQEMCRVSSRYVLIDYPPLISSNILNSIFFPLKKKLEGNTRTFTIFKHSELDAEFSKNGFQLIERRGQFFWPMVIHRKIKSVKSSQFLELIPAMLGITRIFGNPAIAVYKRDSDS